MSTTRRRIAIFPPRISGRPFLLELLGVVLFLGGGFTALNAFIGTVQTFVSDTGPGLGFQILIEGVSGLLALSVAYAIWKELAWGRPALVAFVLLKVIQERLDSINVASIVGGVLTLAFIAWYLYLWPNARNYFRRLREPEDLGGKPPNTGLPADA